MAVPRAGRKVAGGLHSDRPHRLVTAAVGPIVAHPEVAFLGVPLGGTLTMGGLALSFTSGRRIAVRYFDETKKSRERRDAPAGTRNPPRRAGHQERPEPSG